MEEMFFLGIWDWQGSGKREARKKMSGRERRRELPIVLLDILPSSITSYIDNVCVQRRDRWKKEILFSDLSSTFEHPRGENKRERFTVTWRPWSTDSFDRTGYRLNQPYICIDYSSSEQEFLSSFHRESTINLVKTCGRISLKLYCQKTNVYCKKFTPTRFTHNNKIILELKMVTN